MFIGRYVYLDKLDSEQNRTKYQPNSIELSNKTVEALRPLRMKANSKLFFWVRYPNEVEIYQTNSHDSGTRQGCWKKKSTGIGRNTMLQFRTIFEKDNNRDHSPYDLDLQNSPARGFLVFGFIHKVYGILVSQYLTISVKSIQVVFLKFWYSVFRHKF